MGKYGLLAGYGRLPFLFAEALRSRGDIPVAVAIREEADPKLREVVDNYHEVNVGELNKTIKMFRQDGVDKICFAGKVRKTLMFRDLPLDWRLVKLLASLPDKRDDTILAALTKVFDDAGLAVRRLDEDFPEFFPEAAELTRSATRAEKKDIVFGREMALAIGGLDIGQTVVVKDGAVLAVEAIEGTDRALVRGGNLTGAGAVAVKMAKPRQDMRFDVPMIGADTLRVAAEYKFAVVAFEAQRTMLIERQEIIDLARENNIAVVAID